MTKKAWAAEQARRKVLATQKFLEKEFASDWCVGCMASTQAVVVLFYSFAYFVTLCYVAFNETYVPSFVLDPLHPTGSQLGLSLRTYASQFPGAVLNLPSLAFGVLGLIQTGQTLTYYGDTSGAPLNFVPLLGFNSSVAGYRRVTQRNGDWTSANQWVWSAVFLSMWVQAYLVVLHLSTIFHQACMRNWGGSKLKLAGTLAYVIGEIPAEMAGDEDDSAPAQTQEQEESRGGKLMDDQAKRARRVVESDMPRAEALWASMCFMGTKLRWSQFLAWTSIIKCTAGNIGTTLVFIRTCLGMYLFLDPVGMLLPPLPSGMLPTTIQFGFGGMETIPSYAPTYHFFGASGMFLVEVGFSLLGMLASILQWWYTMKSDNSSGYLLNPVNPSCYLSKTCYASLAQAQGPFATGSLGATQYVLVSTFGAAGAAAFASNTLFARVLDVLMMCLSIVHFFALVMQVAALCRTYHEGIDLNAGVKDMRFPTPMYMLSSVATCDCLIRRGRGFVPEGGEEGDDEEGYEQIPEEEEERGGPPPPQPLPTLPDWPELPEEQAELGFVQGPDS